MEGGDLTFASLSTALGAMVVTAGSGIDGVAALPGGRLGVAGSPLGKSWLLLRLLTLREQGFDLEAEAHPVFGAPPLLRLGLREKHHPAPEGGAPAMDGLRCATAGSRSHRASWLRWSAPRAAARRRCRTSWPGSTGALRVGLRSRREAACSSKTKAAALAQRARQPEPRAAARCRPGSAEAALAEVGLAEAAPLWPRQLSLGMARRVALARALAIGPDLLLLDESFVSLDGPAAAGLRSLVARLRRERPRLAALLVTHDLADTAELATVSCCSAIAPRRRWRRGRAAARWLAGRSGSRAAGGAQRCWAR